VNSFLCPTDDGLTQIVLPYGYFSLGNYLTFFGGLSYGAANPANIKANQRAAFGVNFGARLADFQDGTSKTMVYGEYLRSGGSQDNGGVEQRGMLWQSDEPGGGCLMTLSTPNSSSPDVFYPEWWCPPDAKVDQPCQHGTTSGIDHTATARSRHPGGVNVGLADGSVHFVDDAVDLTVWRAMATIAGGEISFVP
jgi:prepilin-type processing-associated H-X9-DG protein